MKILYIGRYNTTEELTGPEKVAKRIYSLASKENETAFLEYYFDGSKYGIKQKLFGYENVTTENSLKVYRIGLFKILPFLFKFKPDIIHIITFERFSIIAYLYKVFSKAKIIYNVHGIAVYENTNFKKISFSLKFKDSVCEKIFMKLSNVLLFLSEHQLSIARNFYELKREKIKFINNGIDEEFASTKKLLQTESPSLVFIGDSDRKDKDFNFLYSNLNKVKYKCNLFVVGKFNYSLYQTKVDKTTIIPVDKMNRDVLIKFLSDKNIFISSSFYDTFSIAAAECMSLGLIPILTDTTGISKLIRNGENGFVIVYGDGKELADKINLIITDKTLRRKISNEATEIYEVLNWKTVFDSYSEIYRTLV